MKTKLFRTNTDDPLYNLLKQRIKNQDEYFKDILCIPNKEYILKLEAFEEAQNKNSEETLLCLYNYGFLTEEDANQDIMEQIQVQNDARKEIIKIFNISNKIINDKNLSYCEARTLIENIQDIQTINRNDDIELHERIEALSLTFSEREIINKIYTKVPETIEEFNDFFYEEKFDTNLNLLETIIRYWNFDSVTINKLISNTEDNFNNTEIKIFNSTERKSEKEFILPDNLFKDPDNRQYKGLWIEQIACDKKDKALPSSIAELINLFACYGYIDNNYLTKASFAFRLTGRLKPEGLIKRIPWHNNIGYKTLIYFLIRYSNTRHKYEKFESFLSLDYNFVSLKNQNRIEFGQYTSYGKSCLKDDIKKYIDEHFKSENQNK